MTADFDRVSRRCIVTGFVYVLVGGAAAVVHG